MEKIKLLSYGVIVSALLLFGFYSNTMNYASALDKFVLTFSDPAHYGIMDVSYRSASDEWFMASPWNDTIVIVDANDNTYSTSFSTSGGGCDGPKQVLATVSFPYVAIICESGVQYHRATAPFTLLNESLDFQGGNFDRIVEWQDAHRVYMVTEGSASIVWNDLDCVNVDCNLAQAYGTISASGACGAIDNIYDLEIDEVRNLLWFVCDNELIALDLSTSTFSVETTITTTTNQLGGIAYNSNADRIIVTGIWNTANDIYVVNADNGALITTIVLNVFCFDAFPNNSNDLVYLLCDDNTLKVFDISDLAVEASIPLSNVEGIGGSASDTLPSGLFSSDEQVGYVTHNEEDASTGNADQNFVTGFIEGEPIEEGINEAFCALPENEDKLICRLGGDGTLGSSGAFVVGNITQGTGMLGIGCSIGLVDCVTDDNPQTNGLGLLIFLASIFVVVGMFYRSLGSEQTMHLPVYLWAIIIIGLSAFFTITGLIDPVFLILSVIGLIALGAPKLVGVLRGGNSMGSGSTA